MARLSLHIVEPTLYDQTGHGYSYVLSILQANVTYNYPIQVWLDKRGKNLFQNINCLTHKYFYRHLRRLQKFCLYFRLLRTSDTIFITTSELLDLQIIIFYSKFISIRAKIFLHFHQFKQTPKKLKALHHMVKHGHNIQILTPTQKLADVFARQGWQNCAVIPCPTFYPSRDIIEITATCHKVLYAGAARADKGFPLVVALLQYLRNANIQTVFEIQISKPNSQRYDTRTAQALELLSSLPKDNLILHSDTLEQTEYLNLFNNAICLLLYEQNSYHDKFSGVALDAFYAGCPVITIRDTWMGDVTERFDAGIALTTLTVTELHKSIEFITANYASFQSNAKKAAKELQKLHDPINTLNFVLQTRAAPSAVTTTSTFAIPMRVPLSENKVD